MKLKDKVLVVEDEQNISNFISTVLTANDFDVLVAQTGAEAVSMITSHCPDLIILDLGLPDMDGMNILKEVRSWSSLPIIVVSARTHEHDKVMRSTSARTTTSKSRSARASCSRASARPSVTRARRSTTTRSRSRASSPSRT